MPLQTGTGLIIAYKKEVAFGTLPANDAAAKQLRRVGFNLGLKKDLIRSAEIRRDYQRPAARHGMRKVDGSIGGELSLGSYADFIGSALRRNFTAVVVAGQPLTNVTASVAAPNFVRAAGSWITDGLRVGMTMRWAGWTTTGVANNAKNFTIIALTATGITVAEAVVAKASGDSVTASVPGKVTYTPGTGHTDDSYAFESWAPSAAQSLRFLGNKVAGFDIDMPPNDKVSIDIAFMGQNRVKDVSQYFAAATAAGTSQMQTGLSGALYLNGVAYGILTAFKLSATGSPEMQPVVGSNLTPDVFQGPVDVSGSFSVLWQSGVIDDHFDLEQEVPLVVTLRDTTAAASEFMTLTLPYIKLGGGDQADSERAIIQSFDFTARVGDGANGYEATTLMVHDSLAP